MADDTTRPALDETDRLLLATLRDQGRISNQELADAVHLSPSACLRRVRRLEAIGVITGYRTVLDPAALGLDTTAFVEITLRGQTDELLAAFEQRVADCPGVVSCHLMAGDFDYLLQVVCADVADYERIHRSYLATLPGVDRLRTSFALRPVVDAQPIAPSASPSKTR